MLKYLYVKEIFREVPGEISLGLSISGCQIQCPECNQKELWWNKGKLLTIDALEKLLKEHRGITCVCFLGGEHDMLKLSIMFKRVKKFGLKVAWYTGLDEMPDYEHIRLVDYIKLGHYDDKLGGLNNPNTNQRFYKLEHRGNNTYYKHNLTHLFQTV